MSIGKNNLDNNLNSDKVPHLIAASVVDMTINMKSTSQNVSVSNIIMCNDKFNVLFILALLSVS